MLYSVLITVGATASLRLPLRIDVDNIHGEHKYTVVQNNQQTNCQFYIGARELEHGHSTTVSCSQIITANDNNNRPHNIKNKKIK